MKSSLTQEIFKFIKFGVTGVMNTAVDFAVFMLLTFAGVGAYTAQAVSYSCGILNSYIVNRSWTFKSGGRFLGPQMARFIAANLSLLLMSVALLWFFTARYNMMEIAAKACSTVIIMLAGFAVNRLWVFKDR